MSNELTVAHVRVRAVKRKAAKEHVKESEWWRVVDFDLSDENARVDWTHEREWRMCGDIEFDSSQVHALLNSPEAREHFCRTCREMNGDVLGQHASSLTLPPRVW